MCYLKSVCMLFFCVTTQVCKSHDHQNGQTVPDLNSGMQCPRHIDLRVAPSVSKGDACAAHLAADLCCLTECCSSLALAAPAAESQPPCLAPATGRDKLTIGVLAPLELTGSGNSNPNNHGTDSFRLQRHRSTCTCRW